MYKSVYTKSIQFFSLTDLEIIAIIYRISGYGEVWYRAWFGSKRPRVRIPILRPNLKARPVGGLSFLFVLMEMF